MLALYRSGRQADALAAYQDGRRLLVEELGLEPSTELRELEQRILVQDPALDPPASAAPPDDRLPATTTSLVARELEVAAVTALLRRPEVRLVTLTGTGGTGKTRLALEAAREIGGAIFVDLASVSDPALVLSTIARALGIDEEPTNPLLDTVAAAVAARPTFVLLDNVEHLPDAFASVAELLAAAPALRVLATSRVPLRITAEHEYRVPPLAAPAQALAAPDEIASSPAVRLYVERARAVVPEFELSDANARAVARIVRALDGLPLAIELAAARIRVLGPEGTARNLGESLALLTRNAPDLPERQRSVRGAIDWSYRLLDERSQRTFRTLGVFAGTATLAAVEAVARDEHAPDTLDALLDAGLVFHAADAAGEPRFGLLETIRAFALAALDDSGELAACRRAHTEWYVTLVEEIEAQRAASPLASAPYEASALATLDADYAELLAVLAHAVDERETSSALRLSAAMRPYWRTKRLFEDATVQLERVVSLLPDEPPAEAGPTLNGAAFFAYLRGEWERARVYGEPALAALERGGDLEWAARTRQLLAATANAQGDPERARVLCREAAAYFRDTEHWYGLTLVLGSIAESSRRLGDLDGAREAIAEALSLRALHGDESLYAFNVVMLAGIATQTGDNAAAARLIHESLAIAIPHDDIETIPPNLFLAAGIAAAVGDHERAGLLLGAAEQALRRLGDGRYEMEREEYFDPVDAQIAAALGRDGCDALRGRGLELTAADAADLAAGLSV